MVQALLFIAVRMGGLALVAASAWIFGATVLRRFGLDDGGQVERWALGSALGLGIVAEALFVVGTAGGLEPRIVLALLAGGHLVCHRTWRALWAGLRARRLSRAAGARLALAAAAAIPFFLLALYPPTGFDANVYHLPYVEAFLEAHRLTFVPDLRFPVFPQVVEMDFLLAFVVAGDVAAQLTQVLAMFLTAALVLAFGRRFGSPRAGAWAAALWLGTPLVVWIANMAYIDVGLTLFVTAAFYCWERWRDGGYGPWLALAGVFAGLAASTKYLGIFFCGILAAQTAYDALVKRSFRTPAVLGAAMLVTLLPWYARIVYYTGNPVFPFYGAVFGESEWTSLNDREMRLGDDAGAGAVAVRQAERIGHGIGFLLLAPWNAVFDREVFNYLPPSSPFYLVLLPLGVPAAVRRSRERRLLATAVLYGVFWLTTVRDLRFLLPVFPVLNLALFAGLERWAATAIRRSHAAGLALLLLAPGPLYAAYKVHGRGKLPVTPAQRQEYLCRQLPGYAAIRWLNDERGHDYTVYALHFPRLRYSAEGRFLGTAFGPSSYDRIDALAGDGRALHAELSALGATHFLVPRRLAAAKLLHGGSFERRFRLVWQDSEASLYELTESSEQSRQGSRGPPGGGGSPRRARSAP